MRKYIVVPLAVKLVDVTTPCGIEIELPETRLSVPSLLRVKTPSWRSTDAVQPGAVPTVTVPAAGVKPNTAGEPVSVPVTFPGGSGEAPLSVVDSSHLSTYGPVPAPPNKVAPSSTAIQYVVPPTAAQLRQ